ncbi:hypothetical protein IWQ62_002747 [Dispira parvispora]|uniref:Uncharacterized protein n=1 Tax=Dispira parvispora TaxID=1520584 RepID=A0A9W8E761_9FUNG|nr:hypothetical protein IWQ62_002747 [Dispira parvispora]
MVDLVRRFILGISVLLLLVGQQARGSEDSFHPDKRPKHQHQPEEELSTKPNRMSLGFICNPENNPSGLEPKVTFSQACQGNRKRKEPFHHSGPDAIPDDSTENNPSSFTDVRPEKNSWSSVEQQVTHPGKLAESTFPDSTDRTGSLRVDHIFPGYKQRFHSELLQFIMARYPISEREFNKPAVTEYSAKFDKLVEDYKNGHYPKVETQVKQILKGPVPEELGESLPDEILGTFVMKAYLNSVMLNCTFQRTQSQKSSRNDLPRRIKDILYHILPTGSAALPMLSVRTLFSTQGGIITVSRVMGNRAANNAIIGIFYKRSLQDEARVHFLWLPNNPKYTCENYANHLKRHYYYVRPFSLEVEKDVEYTLAAFLLRFHSSMESRGNDGIDARIYRIENLAYQREESGSK